MNRQQRMIQAFADYEHLYHQPTGVDHSVIGVPVGTRLVRVNRLRNGKWRLWLATKDFIYGTYLDLCSNGMVLRVTVRDGEGDEAFIVRPAIP